MVCVIRLAICDELILCARPRLVLWCQGHSSGRGRVARQDGEKISEVAGEENRRFLASARLRFLMESFQFERVGAFGLNVGRMKLRRRDWAMAWEAAPRGRGGLFGRN